MTTAGAPPADRRPYAVLGATGKQGGATARALLAAGAHVDALVRDSTATRARALADAGCRLVQADLDEDGGLPEALAGTQGVFAVTTFDGPGGPEEEVAQGLRIGAAAAAAGTRVVYTSVGGADRRTGIPHFDSKYRVEEHLRGLDLRHLSVVRPTFFMDNLDQDGPVVEDGAVVFRSPLRPGVPLQMIAAADIGAAAAACLLHPDTAPAAVEIAGDELTAEQVAEVYGRHHRLPASFEPLPLSVLDDTPELQAMFAWFTHPPAYQADRDATRRLVPAVQDLATWLSNHR